jgi:hypothetical protein
LSFSVLLTWGFPLHTPSIFVASTLLLCDLSPPPTLLIPLLLCLLYSLRGFISFFFYFCWVQIIVHFLFLQSKKLGFFFVFFGFFFFYVCDGCDLFNALAGLGGFLLVYFVCCVAMYSFSVGILGWFFVFFSSCVGVYFLCGFFVLSLLI